MARKHKREKSPAYQWYAKDALTDAALTAMNLAAEGMYRRLLDNSWLENGLPNDLNEIYTLSKCKTRKQFDELWKTVSIKFPVAADGRRRNRRQERSRREQRKNSKNKKLAARARWDKEKKSTDARASNADAGASVVHCSSSALALASKNKDQSQSHRPALRAGLAAITTGKEREVKLLVALCDGDILQPLASAGHSFPDVGVLAAALRQHAKSKEIAVTDETAKVAADRALRRWGKSA